MKFSIKDFFSKCNHIRSFLQIWLHLLKKSLMENFLFCAVVVASSEFHNWHLIFNLFSTNVSFLYPLKTSENLQLSDAFRGSRCKTLVENGRSVFRTQLKLLAIFPKKMLIVGFRLGSKYASELVNQFCKHYKNP